MNLLSLDLIDSLLKQIDDLLDAQYQIQIFDHNCILIRNCLNIDEQCQLYEGIKNASLKCKVSKVTQSLKNVTTATKLMSINVNNPNHKERMSPIFMQLQNKIKNCLSSETNINIGHEYKETFIKSLEYKVTNGKLDGHYDKVDGWVFIYSLGNTANFFINDKAFKFCSGDVLIFDTSRKANIFHGVSSIQTNSYPFYLHKIKEYRISVQIRLQKANKLRVKSDKIRQLMFKLDELR